MRLVGASNFYIQLPFLLEAAIAAAVGCVLASISLIVFKHFVIDNQLTNTFKFTPFIGWDSVWLVIPVLFVVGIGLSVISAFFTLLRYLKV
jgi:cell division transport system permease protein